MGTWLKPDAAGLLGKGTNGMPVIALGMHVTQIVGRETHHQPFHPSHRDAVFHEILTLEGIIRQEPDPGRWLEKMKQDIRRIAKVPRIRR
jgi:hypothetical protein